MIPWTLVIGAFCALYASLVVVLNKESNWLQRIQNDVLGTWSDPYQRENATLLTLCRNSDMYDMLETIRNVEDRFNHQFHYDWVFLNDLEFTDEFKLRVSSLVSGRVKFGKISPKHWSLPSFISREKFDQSLHEMKGKVVYGDSESYRHMCRWYSGFFQWHELLLDYQYYWRVEPQIKFFCDIDYDIFKYMREHGKKYAFIISIYEYKVTISNLFKDVLDFFQHPENEQLIRQNFPKDNLQEFIIDPISGDYNLCHFWTNFEIANLDIYRSEVYQEYFNFLDKRGGFFYERYGDGPVRSIFNSLFLEKDEIHWVQDFGYLHPPYLQCPMDAQTRLNKRCTCDETRDFTSMDYSCTPKFIEIMGILKK